MADQCRETKSNLDRKNAELKKVEMSLDKAESSLNDAKRLCSSITKEFYSTDVLERLENKHGDNLQAAHLDQTKTVSSACDETCMSLMKAVVF